MSTADFLYDYLPEFTVHKILSYHDFQCEHYTNNGIKLLKFMGILDKNGYYIQKEPFKLVESGVIFQQQCRNGLRFDVAVSWFQKSIRRGNFKEALYCAYHICDLGKMFQTFLLNRLAIIMSEDIGPAEPDLPIWYYDKYRQLKKDRTSPMFEQTLIEIIHKFCNARKSRICGLISASSESAVPSSDDWKALIAKNIKTSVVKTLQTLQMFYNQNKASSSCVLFYIHAKYLTELEGGTTVTPHPQLLPPPSQLPPLQLQWNEIGTWKIPVLDDAFDKHTLHGRTYLNRRDGHYYLHGCKLNNHCPFPEEQRMLTSLIHGSNKNRKPESIKIRKYQSEAINKITNRFTQSQVQVCWMQMPCGTGKTKTSFWISRVLNSRKILVLCPLLSLVNQFYTSWQDMMLAEHPDKTMLSTIISSDTETIINTSNNTFLKLKTDEQIKYYFDKLKLKNDDDIDDIDVFEGFDIYCTFTTYSSAGKIPHDVEWDLVIYDEAHKNTIYNFEDCAKSILKMSATPPLTIEPDYRYSFNSAVEDYSITDYRINIVKSITNDIAIINYIRNLNTKIIVFCDSNITAEQLHKVYVNYFPMESDFTFTITHKIVGKQREELMSRMRRSSKWLVFNCRILSEGIDIPECDCIFYHSGVSSYNRVIQSFGRCTRLYTGKTSAQIYMMDDLRNLDKILGHFKIIDKNASSKITYV